MCGWANGWWGGMGGVTGDLRPSSPVIRKSHSCSKARSAQITLAIRV